MKALVLTGPTGVGKSDLSVKIASELFPNVFEIISADSVQVYKYLNVGSGKIRKEEMGGVNHYLIDEVYPDEDFDVSKFIDLSEKYSSKIYSAGRIPFFVGGSSLYLTSFFEGLSKIPDTPPEIRSELLFRIEKEGVLSLYKELQACDKMAASSINQNDSQRIVRALEVYISTGRTISSYWSEKKSRLTENTLFISIQDERSLIYEKINRRVDDMIQNGLIPEVQGLIDMSYSEKNKSMRSIGYSEVIKFLKKEYTYDEAIYNIKRNSRKYAKKQLTWFRNKNNVVKYNVNQKDCIIKDVENFIKRWDAVNP